jgi:hypothetical protein
MHERHTIRAAASHKHGVLPKFCVPGQKQRE